LLVEDHREHGEFVADVFDFLEELQKEIESAIVSTFGNGHESAYARLGTNVQELIYHDRIMPRAQ